MKRTITLSAYSRSSLEKEIGKLIKKCQKLGVPAPTFKIGETYGKSYETGVITIDSCPHSERINFELFDLEIGYEPIKLADWEAIAIVRHDEGQWLQFDIQADYAYNFEESLKNRTCEHCGHQRLSKSFVLRKGDEYKKVGSTCLKDFTGVNPEKYFNLFKYIQNFFGGEEFSYKGGGIHGRNYTVREVDDVLNIAGRVLDIDKKYIKATYHEQTMLEQRRNEPRVRNNSGQATSDKVHMILRSLSRIKYYETHPEEEMPEWVVKSINEFKNSPYFRTDYNSQFASDVRTWLTNMEVRTYKQKRYVGDPEGYEEDKFEDVQVENEMDTKMKAFSDQKRIMEQEVGFVGYIAWAYKQSLIPKAVPGHFFENGQKVELKIKKIGGFNFGSQFGTTYVEIYATDDNKEVKYMGANPLDISKEEFVTVKATVKHDSYQGKNETKLQRIKII